MSCSNTGRFMALFAIAQHFGLGESANSTIKVELVHRTVFAPETKHASP